MYYVRRVGGKIVELVGASQEGITEAVEEDSPEVLAFMDPPREVSVSARQFRLMLRQWGILDAVKAWVATQSGEVQDAFEYSSTFVKNDPVMATGFAQFGFTPEQVDTFFEEAAKL